MQYEIFEGNMERLGKKLTRIENKCRKYGCDFTYNVIGETFKEIKDNDGKKKIARFVIVEVEGKAIVNNWEFIGTIEHTEKGNIIRTIKNVEVPEKYYTTKPICEHCHIDRERKDTYIVRNMETGEFKQVGKSCLKDFTNGMSAEMAAQYISAYDDLIQGEEVCGIGSGYQNYIDRYDAMLYLSETVRKFGYIKRDADGISTIVRTENYIDYDCGRLPSQIRDDIKEEMERVNYDRNSEDNKTYVDAVIKWIMESTEENDYMHNLKVICGLEYIRPVNFGILASAFPSYYKAMKLYEEKKARESENAKSDYVGNIGDKVTVDVKDYKVLTSFETEWGWSTIYSFTDADGNIYVWKTSKCLDDKWEKQEKKLLKGTIKDHKEYRGTKQTELTRCKLIITET